MSIYKRGSIYWYKFMWNGAIIRESTRQGTTGRPQHRIGAQDEAFQAGGCPQGCLLRAEVLRSTALR
jgi:hypothetical protein